MTPAETPIEQLLRRGGVTVEVIDDLIDSGGGSDATIEVVSAALDQVDPDELVAALLASEEPTLQRAIARREVTIEELRHHFAERGRRRFFFACMAYGLLQSRIGAGIDPNWARIFEARLKRMGPPS